MSILKQCCCCISLRSGGLILGVIALVGTLFTLLILDLGLWGAITVADVLRNSTAAQNETTTTATVTVKNTTGLEGGPTDEEMMDAFIVMTKVSLVMYILLDVLHILCAILLIYGSLKSRHRLLLPYLWVDATRIIFALIKLIYKVYQMFVVGHYHDWSVASIIGYVVYIACASYLWLCVFSLYQHIKEEKQRLRIGEMPPNHQNVYNPTVVYSAVAQK